MKIELLEDLYVEELRDLYDAEKKLGRMLPKLAKAATAPELQGSYLKDLWGYLEKNLSFGFGSGNSFEALPDFAGELVVYASAKKPRNSLLSCTICNSTYTTKKQEDASVLFQPWVYKNRLPLYKGENAGGISRRCWMWIWRRRR